MLPLITAVMPVYNVAPYLPRALNSLINQTFTNYEIILVDDGSTDGCAGICDDYAGRHSNVRVMHQRNGGVSDARNAGMLEARGRYIVFPDSDDWVAPDYLESFLLLKREYGSDLVCLGLCPVDDKGVKWQKKDDFSVSLTSYEALEDMMGPGRFVSPSSWNKLFDLDIIRKNGLMFDTDLARAEDLFFLTQYLLKCETVVYNNHAVYYYYNREGSAVNFGLSANNLSGMKANDRIIALTKKEYPKIASLALCRKTYASFIFLDHYKKNNAKDARLYKQLLNNIRRGLFALLAAKHFKIHDKLFILLAAVSPRLYWITIKFIRGIRGKNLEF